MQIIFISYDNNLDGLISQEELSEILSKFNLIQIKVSQTNE